MPRPPGASPPPSTSVRRRPLPARASDDGRLGGRALGRSRLVRGPAERRSLPVPGTAGRRTDHPAKSVLVGRPSKSRGINPEIDCGDDTGVSRRQAQLTTDGQRWWVEDLQSSNGTYVAPSSSPLPEDPIPPGQRRELNEDDRIYIGASTRLVVRRATPEEQAGAAS